MEKHFREFLIPSLKLYSEISRKENQNSYVSITSRPLVPFVGKFPTPATPSRKTNHWGLEEFGVLTAFLKSFNLWGYLEPGLRNTLNGTCLFRPASSPYGAHRVNLIDSNKSAEDHLHWYLKTCCKSIKSRLAGTDKQVILLGRDVWLVSVLCDKMSIPYVFDPRVSRGVAASEDVCSLFPGWTMREGDILFDTGFAGTIHSRITERSGIHLENLMVSSYDKAKQLFPNSGIARNYALCVEYLPKYFKTGTVKEGEIMQYYSDFPAFVEAAMLTVWTRNYQSPALMYSDRGTSYFGWRY